MRVAYYGGVEVEWISKQWKMSIDPTWKDGSDLYDAYVARIVEWDFETSYAHRRVRLAAGVPQEHPWPEGLDDFVLRERGAAGLRSGELLAYYPTSVDRDFHVRRLTQRLFAKFDQPRGAKNRVDCDIRAMLLRYPELALPDTCATDCEMEQPSPTWLGRAMQCGSVAELACAAQIIASEGKRLRHRSIGRGFEILADKIDAMGPKGELEPDQLVEALLALLDDAAKYKSLARTRTDGVRSVLSALRGLSIYRMAHPGQLERLAPLFSRAVHQNTPLRDKVRRLDHAVRGKDREKRKRDAREVTDRFEQFRETVAVRALEARACGAQLAQAREKASEHFAHFDAGERMEPFYEVFTALPVFDEQGLPIAGARQLASWRLWREGDLWRSIDPREDICPNWSGLDREDMQALGRSAKVHTGLFQAIKAHGSATRIVTEFIGCIADIGGRTSEPHLIKQYRTGILSTPTESPPQIQRERCEYMRDNNIPMVSVALQPCGYGYGGFSIARWARQVGRCVVPVDDAVMGTRFAHCFIGVVTDCLARRMEVFQIAQTDECIRHDLGASASLPGFKAVPKGRTQPEGYVLSEMTCETVLGLAEDVAKACGHTDGWLRDVDANDCLPPRIARRAPYVFQWDGKPLASMTVAYLVALLSAGFGKVTPHILRHAASNNMMRRGVHARAVQAKLKHHSEVMSDYYRMPTAIQVQQDLEKTDEEQRILVRETSARLSRIGASRREGKGGEP